MPMGMADIATVLFRDFLRFDPQNPDWANRDRFVVSNGHGSMLLYSVLHLTGYDISLNDIKDFRKMGSKTAGHPEYGHCPGVETTTGPLGQGVANAVGMALALRKKAETIGFETPKIYVTLGDGCLMEGISHEACELASAQKLNNLILLFDDNDISIDGRISITSRTEMTQRFESYGFTVLSADGHDENQIKQVLNEANHSKNPVLIRFKTTIGYGSPAMADTAKAHGSPLGDAERAATAKALNWPHAPFEIPEDIYTAWRNFGTNSQTEPNGKKCLSADLNGIEGILNSVKKNVAENETDGTSNQLATRKASGIVIDKIYPLMKGALISGSADLTGSVNTLTKNMTILSADNPKGDFVHYGVREHAMAAVMNGLALCDYIPTSGTFLAFADYMKPAMRMSALMEQRVIYVLTHDSIGLGEDGPTHQPVEQLSMLRAMPNFNIYRPCDLAEMAECWQLALTREKTPSGIVASRQNLPTLRTTYTEENLSARGAYVIHPEYADIPLDIVLMASGSEVHLAVEAAEALSAEGKNARVLSVPCMEHFLAQEPMYHAGLLPADIPRIAIEAAARQSWDRLLNDGDTFIGMDDGAASTFGASAPASDLYQHYGITVENITATAKELIK